jgi:DNA (cytosine-5)-methyltransferase 1
MPNNKKNKAQQTKYSVTSLFAGCGGFDLGTRGAFDSLGTHYDELPFELEWANDFNKKACQTYEANLGKHIHHGDIREILKNPSEFNFPKITDIVTGGFPCQSFSLSGKRLGFADPRGELYLSMKEAVKRLQPKVFIAENVRGLLNHDEGKTFLKICSEFAKLGYHITWKLYKAVDFGVPQTRERVLVVGTRKDILPEFPHPGPAVYKHATAHQAIDDLKDIDWGVVPNHEWTKCKKNKGQGNNKIKANAPAPTMRAEHHGNIEFHYSAERRLSAREAARIQTFPDDFIFKECTGDAYRQIGNAVPPVLAWHLAKEISRFLDAHEMRGVK